MREWPYKDIKPRIIAEQYMEDNASGELRDYKFFCFDGKVKALFIASDRMTQGEETKFDFFDADYNHLPFRNGHPNASVLPNKPLNFDKMKELAAQLSAGYPQVRVDLYEVNGKVYFGELTFSTWAVWLRSNRKTGITNSENGLHYHLKQDKMGTVHTIENHLTAISRTIRRVLVSYSERQNIQKTKIDR